MNYIKKLQAENDQLKQKIESIQGQLTEILAYLNSEKFHGIENNYVHVTTDIYPKINFIKMQCHMNDLKYSTN